MKEFLIEEAVGIAAYLLVTLIGLLGAWLSSKLAKLHNYKLINSVKLYNSF